MNRKSFKGFYRFENPEPENMRWEEQFNIVQQVPGDGVEFEFMISFYRYGKGLSARVEVFDDAFVAFERNSELFDELAKCKNVTPEVIENILLTLGYRKLTDYKENRDEQ